MQEKQYDMPQYLVLCTDLFSLRKLVLKVYAFKARVYIDTFFSNQTILQFCENWIDD